VPPHKRGHNVQEDKFVNHKKGNDQDRAEGVDNDKYLRLMLPVPYALHRDKLKALKLDFPGVFFHCRDNSNHDHPFSHAVTMIGTRFMQRKMRSGTKILDVYGNPNACDKFNSSQIHADSPKFMKAVVSRSCPADYIREVNKWGPFFDENEGVERYHRGDLMSLVRSGEIEKYDVLQMVHTLYYIPFEELAAALAAPGKRVAYALVHRHRGTKGSLNDGEQTFEKKWVGDVKLLRQLNVATGSVYVHPDLTDVLFAERKVWLPKQPMEYSDSRGKRAESVSTDGLTWECHIVNDDTWVVEFVSYREPDAGHGGVDYAAMWNDDSDVYDDDFLATPSTSPTSEVQLYDSHVVIPTVDGKFLSLDIPCKELFNHLRARCSGRERTPKLLEELISTANHLVQPSTLFGDKVGMRCPPDKIYDVAMAAWAIDVLKEANIVDQISLLRPVLNKHAKGMKLGPRIKDLCFRDLMQLMRLTLQGVKDVNKIVRHKDPLDFGVSTLQDYLAKV
jgi:hypothetical protein